MSTDAVHTLEFLMADLMDCFEDFVKRSLMVISVALGTIILMIMYVLKLVAERNAGPRNAISLSNNRVLAKYRDNETKTTKDLESITNDYTVGTETSTQLGGGRPSTEEVILKEIGLSSCSKRCNTSERIMIPKDSAAAELIAAGFTCMAKHHLSTPRPCLKYGRNRTSCCSMCCPDHK